MKKYISSFVFTVVFCLPNLRGQITTFYTDSVHELENQTVYANRAISASSSKTISQFDFKSKPRNSAQELLKLVPGLFIAQHAGGGKAEQIFLRGFDCDHGTDVASYVDGVQVNLPSHGHGQGYMDLHFLISETVKDIQVSKGTYNAFFGNFATAGEISFSTSDSISKNLVQLTTVFNPQLKYLSGKKMVGLLKIPSFSKKSSNYLAFEVLNNRSFFEKNQFIERYNFFYKSVFKFNESTKISSSFSSFYSTWYGSGQIPVRAVSEKLISEFGSIDPSEGGKTARYNANFMLTKKIGNNEFSAQAYVTKNEFQLFSNFTFFLLDSLNGDQIEQTDERIISGLILRYSGKLKFIKLQNKFSLGTSLKNEFIENGLHNAKERNRISTKRENKLNELNTDVFFNETILLNPKIRLEVGGRFDLFQFTVKNQAQNYQYLFSPKLNLIYSHSQKTQLFLNFGQGFHTNDTRSAAFESENQLLPKALGSEVGINFKATEKILISATVWGLNSQNELVYVGDEGNVENKGSSRRFGFDLGGRLFLTKFLSADFDFNYSLNYLTDSYFGRKSLTDFHIPLAPIYTSVGGLSYKRERVEIQSRFRILSNRPANEANSLTASGYTLFDLNFNYEFKKIKFLFAIENLLNVNWKEAQFEAESKLLTENESVTEIHFTPGTPFALKIGFEIKF